MTEIGQLLFYHTFILRYPSPYLTSDLAIYCARQKLSIMPSNVFQGAPNVFLGSFKA